MKKVLLIMTGGTIVMKKGKENYLDISSDNKPPEELIRIIEMVKDDIEVDIESIFSIDSTDITPEYFSKIAKTIYENYESYDGFVVSHGTDTMAYSASAVAFILQNIGKPVVFTGAQLPLSNIYTDGTNNLINSLLLAAKYDVGEVCILFGTKIIRATRARKVSAFDLQAFDSINREPLGTIGLSFKIGDNVKGRRHSTRIKYYDKFNDNVVLIKMHPGINENRFKDMCQGADGIVLEGYGAGHIPQRLLDVIKDFISKNVPVVVCTQCLVGRIELERYKVGKKLSEIGVISAYDMTPEAALVKLMWILAQTKDLNDVKKMFWRDLAGEFS